MTARRQLSEHAALNAQLILDYEMRHVVRHYGVVTGRGIHYGRNNARALDRNAITPFTGPCKGDLHA
jgi:hypothetical protein